MVREPIKEILLNNKKIGLFVSGGLDSGLLLYLMHLLREELQTENEFKIYTVSRPNNSMVYTRRVVDWIADEFDVSYDINQVGTDRIHHTMQVISGLREAAKDNVDIFVLGDTKNPAELVNGPNRRAMKLERYAQPWIEITKDQIVQEVIDCNLTDLMTISHSCENPEDGTCGECWHCNERAWAFYKCGYDDPQQPPREKIIFELNYTF